MGFKGAGNTPNAHKTKTPPPDDTRQEAAYLKALGEKQTPVSIKLMDGEVLRGWIEYYDRRMVRLTQGRRSQPVHLQARNRVHSRRPAHKPRTEKIVNRAAAPPRK